MASEIQPELAKPKAIWRTLNSSDIDDLFDIANQVHTSLPERKEVFAERIKIFPEGCLALHDKESHRLGGYIISRPIRRYQPPTLDILLDSIPLDANQYYIHDIAILPKYRGSGAAQDGTKQVLAVGERFSSTCLISVYGTAVFWKRFGFAGVDISDELREKIEGYGDDAAYLERENGS